jgi:hypothetical protein
VLATEDERCESPCVSANRSPNRRERFSSGITFVMRLARSSVLGLFALFRPKISLARASFFLRWRSTIPVREAGHCKRLSPGDTYQPE